MTTIRRPDGTAGELPEGSVLVRCGTSRAGTGYIVRDGELVELSETEAGALPATGFNGCRTAARGLSWENDVGKWSVKGVHGQDLPDHD